MSRGIHIVTQYLPVALATVLVAACGGALFGYDIGELMFRCVATSRRVGGAIGGQWTGGMAARGLRGVAKKGRGCFPLLRASILPFLHPPR